jgi:hypothetical protein
MPAEAILIFNQNVIANKSAAANQSSVSIDAHEARLLNLQYTFTGSPTGTLSLQGSNDSITFAPIQTPTAISAAGTNFITIVDFGCRYVKVVYTFTSGSGTLNAYLVAKR